MPQNELQFDTLTQRNLQVLQAYADRHFAAKAADDDYTGWLDRVESAGDLNTSQLTRVHGELIALGMLLKGIWVRLACIGAIIFLLAIAPLGLYAAFPFSLIAGAACFFILKQDDLNYLWRPRVLFGHKT